MVNNIQIVEKKIDEFSLQLEKLHANDRKSTTSFQDLIDMYESVTYDGRVVVALYDEQRGSFLFLNKESEKITGYKRETLIKWGPLVLFKALHYSHYSYPISELKFNQRFRNQIPVEQRKNAEFYSVGIKFYDGNERLRRAFVKSKTVVFSNSGKKAIVVLFGEDITHLFRGDHYWIRMQCGDTSMAYVKQKGKKEFKDLLSKREMDVLRLVAEKKSSAEIASELYLSKLTIETHRKNMIKRTGAIDSTALVHLCRLADII